ncbi:MAG: hypothetical protein P4M05_12350 [Bradyrhizobium sp.]|nr:hypothetical protein [Bradyrhizobium sp.]
MKLGAADAPNSGIQRLCEDISLSAAAQAGTMPRIEFVTAPAIAPGCKTAVPITSALPIVERAERVDRFLKSGRNTAPMAAVSFDTAGRLKTQSALQRPQDRKPTPRNQQACLMAAMTFPIQSRLYPPNLSRRCRRP